MTENVTTGARLATLDELGKSILPLFLSPVPCKATLRAWFKGAKIPIFKTNLAAKRGGGPVYYSVPAVEKLMRSRGCA